MLTRPITPDRSALPAFWNTPMPNTRLQLNQLTLGDTARIVEISGTDAVTIRLYEMGFTEDEEVRFLARAPLGDPLEFELRGYRISLRSSEASRVQVEPIAGTP